MNGDLRSAGKEPEEKTRLLIPCACWSPACVSPWPSSSRRQVGAVIPWTQPPPESEWEVGREERGSGWANGGRPTCFPMCTYEYNSSFSISRIPDPENAVFCFKLILSLTAASGWAVILWCCPQHSELRASGASSGFSTRSSETKSALLLFSQ